MANSLWEKKNPIKDYIAAVSCGVLNGDVFVDLDYSEDSIADVDANFVFTKELGIAEIQISGEKNTFSLDQVTKMINEAKKAADQIFKIQESVIL